MRRRKQLKEMISFGEAAEKTLSSAPHPCRIRLSMNLQRDRNYFEKLPLLSLILKRVVSDYPEVVFTLYRMSCQNNVVNCVVEFSETKDWVSIINAYESNLVVGEVMRRRAWIPRRVCWTFECSVVLSFCCCTFLGGVCLSDFEWVVLKECS